MGSWKIKITILVIAVVILSAIGITGFILMTDAATEYGLKWPSALKKMKNDIDRAKYILIRCEIITSPLVTEDLKISPNTWAFSILMDDASRSGIKEFLDVYDRAEKPEGKVYALTGIYWLDKDTYQRLLAKTHFLSVTMMNQSDIYELSYEELVNTEIPSGEFLHNLMMKPLPGYSEIIR